MVKDRQTGRQAGRAREREREKREERESRVPPASSAAAFLSFSFSFSFQRGGFFIFPSAVGWCRGLLDQCPCA